MLLTNSEVEYLHDRALSQHGGTQGIRNRGLVESAIAQPCQTFDGNDLYPSLLEKIATLGFGLMSNHGYVDGNKRVGFAAMAVVIEQYGGTLEYDLDEAEAVCTGVAAGTHTKSQLLAWLTKSVRNWCHS